MAKTPTQIPVKSKRTYRKRVAVKHPKPEATAVNGVQKKNPGEAFKEVLLTPRNVQPAFATEKKAPAKRPLGRPRNETTVLTKEIERLESRLAGANKKLENEQEAHKATANKAADYLFLIRKVSETSWLGKRFVAQAKKFVPWVELQS